MNCVVIELLGSMEKITKTIRLNHDVYQRLVSLCDHLGTNPNAYLISEIGKCISRDELTFRATKNNADLHSLLMPILQGIVEAENGDKGEEQTDLFENGES